MGIDDLFGMNPFVNPSAIGSDPDEDVDVIDDNTEGASELLLQEDNEQGPTRSQSETPRGTPIEGRNNLGRELFRRGEERIRALTNLFGADALVLGHLLFDIPPLAIRIKKGNITYRVKPLRTKESIAIPSGNGTCFIEMDLVFNGLHQIQTSLAELVALWKKSPFCFIENAHIRKMMIPDRPDESMAVCLETLVVDAIAGKPSTVYATLLTRWFNYKTYSQNFWFRDKWEPADGGQPQQAPNRNQFRSEQESTYEGQSNSPAQTDPRSTVLVDLSAIQDPSILNTMAQDLPPEVGLFENIQVTNPGDPTLAGTYPVVYPFNSQPFLDRIRLGDDRPARINSWNDGVSMSWNSFARMNVPRSWRYTVDSPSEVSIAASRSPSRSTESATPPPVTGERDTILFIGDSIMVGFTGLTSRTACKQPSDGGPSYSTPTFFEWTGNSRFPITNGFKYIAMSRVGASSGTLRNWWNAKKNDSLLKAEGSDEPCSRVAGVLIHTGTNDGDGGPNIEALQTIMSEASGYGAIPMLCPLPPSNDADHLTPPKLGQLRLSWGNTAFEAYQNSLPDYHSSMVNLVNSIDNAMFIDYHNVMVEDRFRGNRAAPLAERFHASVPGHSNYYNIHWNANGYTTGGNYIHGSMPWNSLRGQPPREDESNDMWTVCHIEDGDTIWVYGESPENGETVVRNVRLKFIDTPETYREFENPTYNTEGAAPMPEGQDSYRPNNYKYGAIATSALQRKAGVDSRIRIEWHGTGHYGRYLGVLFAGELNLNLWMVQQGYAFAMPSDNAEESRPYLFAEQEARGQGDPQTAPRGIWAQTAVPLSGLPSGFPLSVQESLRTLMRPDDYRATYASSSDGGHGGTPLDCLAHGDWEEGEDVGGSDPDA